ncbi:protein lifeguard 3-like isoform X2 [Mya arenaria]|uniref:protein lifeguard 3-like isoform X2 n=1 Tax=Mya arenaria TaxID=6604 RepID=UPI0022E68526|nr:protein lifeguard 3-like isoform X2 [Mya arenaria]
MTSNQMPPPPSYDESAQYPNQGYNTVGQQPPLVGYAPPPQGPPQGYGFGEPQGPPQGYALHPQGPPQGYGYEEPQGQPQGYGQAGHGEPELAAPKADDRGMNMFQDDTFSNKTVRRGFIKKVYLILTVQLLVTFGVTTWFSLWKDIHSFLHSSGGVAAYYVSYATFLVTYFVLVCCPGVRRKHPGNLICLGIFTLAFTYMVAMIASFYDTKIVMVAAGITTLVCLAISIFAIQTKIDFTMCSGLLFALVMVLFLFGIACMITYLTVGYSLIMDCVYGGLAALVFSLFLIYDTQMIVGGRKHELSPEEYVYGALQLYIDVVYIFLIILSFFGKK